MTGTMVRQTMFSTGEVDAINWKRSDLADVYITAAQSLLNCEVGTTGLTRKRKGSQGLIDATDYAVYNSHLYEFIDKNNDHYIVLASDFVFHIFSVVNEEKILITGREKHVVTGRGTTVVVDNERVDFVQSVVNVYPIGEVDNLDYTQDGDSIIFSNKNYIPQRLYIDTYTPAPHFAVQPLNIGPYPTYDFNKINYSNSAVTFASTATTFTITVTPGNFTADWIGGIVIGLGNSPEAAIGYGRITTINSATSLSGDVIVKFAPDAEMSPKGAQYSIQQPAWSNTLGWPAKVLYFQNRLWFANTPSLPTTIFGSKINAPINFDVGTGRATDAIVYTIGQTDTGEITWLNGGKQLEIFSDNYEFACPQDTNSGLTPSTFSIRQQSSYGASDLFKPITYINNSYYIAKTGKAFINYNFTGVGLAYKSNNVSAASSHLIKNPINRALLRGTDNTQDNFVYLLNDDDTISIFQFAAEYKFAALTPMVFQEDIKVIDIVSVDNVVYLLKYYVKTETYYIEKLDDVTKVDSFFATDMESSGRVAGLERFEGYTVQVIYLGQDFGAYLVTNGEILVTNPDEIADTVTIGLLYDVKIKPMYIFGGQQNASFKKNIYEIHVDYFESLDFEINGKLVPYQNFKDIQAGLPLTPQTDTAIVSRVNGWERFETIEITQSSPFDLQILGIGYLVNVTAI